MRRRRPDRTRLPRPKSTNRDTTVTAGDSFLFLLHSSMSSSDGVLGKLAAGGASCMVASFILNPMDVIKCRMQMQTSSVSPGAQLPYRSFAQSFGKIASEEGVRGLFKGCVECTRDQLSPPYCVFRHVNEL